MQVRTEFTLTVAAEDDDLRLDAFLASQLPEMSRTAAARLLRGDHIKVNGRISKPAYRVRTGDDIRGCLPVPEPLDLIPEALPLSILAQDEHLIVIDKPPGLVIHPAPGHAQGTLVNRLLHHCPDLPGIGGRIRPGIVHRLDKDTSGVLVVAKTAAAHENLAAQFKLRRIRKTYLALVHGRTRTDHGKIVLPIGRDPHERKRMSTRSKHGRPSETHWRVQERFEGATLLEVDLKTGRTHQIRVHLSAIHHPVVGDPQYGGRRPAGNLPRMVADRLLKAERQMLHARRIEFNHPHSGRRLGFEAPLPEDFTQILTTLRRFGEERCQTGA